jgi:hypothetical protein
MKHPMESPFTVAASLRREHRQRVGETSRQVPERHPRRASGDVLVILGLELLSPARLQLRSPAPLGERERERDGEREPRAAEP